MKPEYPTFSSPTRFDPYRNYRFKVSILSDGGAVSVGGFTVVSGIGDETAVTEWRTGDQLSTAPAQIPQATTYGDITLSRGLDFNGELRKWREQVTGTDTTQPALSLLIRKTVLISVYAENDNENPVKEYKVFNAWPSKYDLSELNSNSPDILVETIVLKNEGIKLTTAEGTKPQGL